MKTLTIEKNVFELEEVKDKAIEKNRYINVDWEDWADFVIEDEEERLESLGFLNPKIYYSGFCIQGDGACFDAEVSFITMLPLLDISEKNREVLEELINEGDIEAKIETIDHHYCHENTRRLYLYCYKEGCEELVEDIEKQIEKLRYDTSKEIYQKLYDEYYYLISDEAVEETLAANDYLFNEDGTIFNN